MARDAIDKLISDLNKFTPAGSNNHIAMRGNSIEKINAIQSEYENQKQQTLKLQQEKQRKEQNQEKKNVTFVDFFVTNSFCDVTRDSVFLIATAEKTQILMTGTKKLLVSNNYLIKCGQQL